MTIMIFTEGTILMHKNAIGHSRQEIVRQVIDGERSVDEFDSYVPIGRVVEKIRRWREHGAEIVYLTSRKGDEVKAIRNVLSGYGFPKGVLRFRQSGESYADVVEQEKPDILVEDDCESIGGQPEMIYPKISSELKQRIKTVVVPEFGGVDHLPDELSTLQLLDTTY